MHHFAALLGYGACAINPYLAHETIGQLIDEGLLDKDYYAAVEAVSYTHLTCASHSARIFSSAAAFFSALTI